MPVTKKIPPLPPANIPVIDPATGKMTEGWYRYFVALQAALVEALALIP